MISEDEEAEVGLDFIIRAARDSLGLPFKEFVHELLTCLDDKERSPELQRVMLGVMLALAVRRLAALTPADESPLHQGDI